MIPVWEVYVIKESSDGEDYEQHIRYFRKVENALEYWKSCGGFQKAYGLRLALAKPKWIAREEKKWPEK